jgi:hypothetical protein
MFYILLLAQVVLFALVFYRLVTTNHWTIGKKLLVGLTGSIIFEVTSFICIMVWNLSPAILVFVPIPKLVVSAIMVYFFYRSELHID